MCAVFESVHHSSNCVKMVAVFGSLQRYIPQLMSAMNEDEEEEGSPQPKLDAEGYVIRPPDSESIQSGSKDSSSDSDSDSGSIALCLHRERMERVPYFLVWLSPFKMFKIIFLSSNELSCLI